jgi:cation diffusion facilitator CzcD-associated flavoprotein CzcO
MRAHRMNNPIETDYLIVGAGAAGMAFADTILTETDARILIVDRHHRPGGHWNDAYPFVRLHQASACYGVNSRQLSHGVKDTVGLNRGLCDLAGGAEVLGYYDQLLRQRFLPSRLPCAARSPRRSDLAGQATRWQVLQSQPLRQRRWSGSAAAPGRRAET